jgi:hypothetical protein
MQLRQILKKNFSIANFNSTKEVLQNLKETQHMNMLSALNQTIDQNMERDKR